MTMSKENKKKIEIRQGEKYICNDRKRDDS